MNRFEQPPTPRDYSGVRKTFEIDELELFDGDKPVCTVTGSWEAECEWDGEWWIVDRLYAEHWFRIPTAPAGTWGQIDHRIDDLPAFKFFVEAAQRWVDRTYTDELELMELTE